MCGLDKPAPPKPHGALRSSRVFGYPSVDHRAHGALGLYVFEQHVGHKISRHTLTIIQNRIGVATGVHEVVRRERVRGRWAVGDRGAVVQRHTRNP